MTILVILGKVGEAKTENIYWFPKSKKKIIIINRSRIELPIVIYNHDSIHENNGLDGSRATFEIMKIKN